MNDPEPVTAEHRLQGSVHPNLIPLITKLTVVIALQVSLAHISISLQLDRTANVNMDANLLKQIQCGSLQQSEWDEN
jgi:hypothetical protein